MLLRKIEQQVRFAQIFTAERAFHAMGVEYNRWRERVAGAAWMLPRMLLAT